MLWVKTDMKIFLIGYRCTGKTTIGKILAHRLNFYFFDTDLLIEQVSGLNISQIVEKYGWKKFRVLEKENFFNTKNNENAVIATGGGIIIDPENQDFMKKNGFCVWLDANLKTILHRLNNDNKTCSSRPSLTNKDFLKETEELINLRKPLYEQTANIRVDTSFQTPKEIVNIITGNFFNVRQ
ncbi:MAG: shikimate kinase [Desulfobacula sp.]|nr:shikimate kinase [Desulfobacula sp.]